MNNASTYLTVTLLAIGACWVLYSLMTRTFEFIERQESIRTIAHLLAQQERHHRRIVSGMPRGRGSNPAWEGRRQDLHGRIGLPHIHVIHDDALEDYVRESVNIQILEDTDILQLLNMTVDPPPTRDRVLWKKEGF